MIPPITNTDLKHRSNASGRVFKCILVNLQRCAAAEIRLCSESFITSPHSSLLPFKLPLMYGTVEKKHPSLGH